MLTKLFYRWWAPKPTPPASYPTGTDAQALNVQPPGALTARDLPNQIGLPGRKAMEGRTRG